MAENKLQAKILKTLREKFPQRYFRAPHTGGGFYRGDPDIYGCVDGKFLQMELKTPRYEPTKLQLVRLAQWSESGAYCCIVRSVEQAIRIVEAIAYSPDQWPMMERRILPSIPHIAVFSKSGTLEFHDLFQFRDFFELNAT